MTETWSEEIIDYLVTGFECFFLCIELDKKIVTGMRWSHWMPLFLIDPICGFHGRRESSVAPKKIGACGSILSPSLILTCSFVVEREKTVDWGPWSPQ